MDSVCFICNFQVCIIQDSHTEPVAEFLKHELFPAISGHISNNDSVPNHTIDYFPTHEKSKISMIARYVK